MSNDARFFSFLKDRIGLDVASVGEAIIERAVRQRCAASSAQDSDGYWQLLQTSASEQQALIEAVIVPETWFFRYPESFSTLGKLAQTRLAELMGSRPLRILSLPCSTGEEPYSIAMALFDAGICPQQFQVDGIDISPLSIERATRAIYGRNSFRGEQITFRDQYFSAEVDGFLLNERVCNQVNFQTGNVLDPTLLAARPAYDFVFCRNLLIYFDLATQQRVFEVLKRMTREEGVLFIGPAEGSLLARLGMRSIGIAQSFAFSRCAEKAEVPPAAVVPLSLPTPVPATFTRSRASLPLRASPRSFASSPPVLASARAVPTPAGGLDNEAASLLANIASLANEGKSAEARAACERYLKLYEPVAQVFYWLGLLSDLGGQTAEAQGLYRKALYLQPQHSEALAQLATLLASQGDTEGARRLQDRAARGLSKEGRNR
ncbi:protein-glutamate O-methyltransferase CheR [Pseudomonas sp. RTC3]|uniref:protein-glutamate O-methyltransferase CheR n=1 Tax=Pseudomonas sp. 5C2 TaxID=3048588 RepID=UPI002AB40FA9|nr:protein-glutamate O-methyltransferase CheR [Pseudomonas sp. 5C2]MDY7563683.1 protein-glutamate O-methyltransferase CheR [Pseudomonas sp. 5C2]MEB0064640.1 protein-glutamate O-methyltransferase CheR [Pseudomonas sp. RTC3]MEB0243105.1 protein-glutamate O-methyltransferase CheR [Pseudomonas sp. 5C2]